MKKYKGVKTLEVLEGADNYNSWIASKIKPYLSSPILEVGAGTGNISEYFTGFKELVLTDYDSELVDFLQEKFKDNKNVVSEVLDISRQFGEIKSKYKSVYSVNVLEHIQNDRKALSNINLLLERGGVVVLLVPAKKHAFTRLDKSLGHFRRYEKQELREKLEHAGFEVEKIEYFNLAGLLSWKIREKVTRNHSNLKTSHVKMFDSIVPLLRLVEPKKDLSTGISLIAVAKKQ